MANFLPGTDPVFGFSNLLIPHTFLADTATGSRLSQVIRRYRISNSSGGEKEARISTLSIHLTYIIRILTSRIVPGHG